MRLFIIGLCIAIGIIGCSTTEKNNEDLLKLKAVWEKEYAAWKKLNIHNYEFIIANYNTGTHQKIIVKNGIYESAINISSGEAEKPVFELGTIDALFDKINDNFLTEEKGIYPSGQIGTKFTVRYDVKYHYPIEYTRVDVYDKKIQMDGNVFTIEITEFVQIEE